MTWVAIGGTAASAVIGGVASNQAANTQAGAAGAAGRQGLRGYYSNVAVNEPWRQAGNNALATIGGMYGWEPAPYTSAQDLSAMNTPLNAKEVRNLLKQGMTYDQIRARGRLVAGINPKAVKRLVRAGLSQEQIQGLSAAHVPQSAPTAAPGGPAAPAAALPPGTPEGTDPRFAAFFNSPDYVLRRDAALEGIQRTAAARSGAVNPATMLAVGNTAGAMQGAEYGDWYNRLMGIAQGGQNANNAVTGAQTQYTGQAMNATQAQGDARASGILGVGNSITGAIGSGMDAYLMQQYLNRPQSLPPPAPGGVAPGGGTYSQQGPWRPQYGGYQFQKPPGT